MKDLLTSSLSSAELKRVLKEDAGLELNMSKTAVLSKAITQQALFDVAHAFIVGEQKEYMGSQR